MTLPVYLAPEENKVTKPRQALIQDESSESPEVSQRCGEVRHEVWGGEVRGVET